ncbi:uncharacterized protein RMCB_6516 [Mycolicibacterium brisbanense]|uniref:Uncharacterized protein n=1 Tax=Mycolicibacterium brisbanense TaxID=146020 RepID=A0A124E136_9MYCO|nr:uncharacterized protein RMCB_6516 [Mycolicibacterium brisbanense]
MVGRHHHERQNLLAGHDDDDAGERTAAEHWLEDYLTENRATPSKTVKVEARKEGISFSSHAGPPLRKDLYCTLRGCGSHNQLGGLDGCLLQLQL